MALRKFIIERDIPAVGSLEREQLRGAAAKSNGVLRELGPDIQWVESYVAADTQPIGLTKDAFDDDDPDGVSVTWIEYFAGASDCERTAIAAICGTLTVRRTHRFGKFNVGMIRAVGTDAGVVLGVEHDPIPGNEGHALIKGLVPSEHFALMNRLALELVALLSPNL
jgi:Nickel responsive protein SCO4226-like